MWPNAQETVDLVAFTEEIPNEKLYFCAVLTALSTGTPYLYFNGTYCIVFVSHVMTVLFSKIHKGT